MNRAAAEKNLRQFVVLLVLLGVIGTAGFVLMFIAAVTDERAEGVALMAVVYTVSMWIGLGFMILVCQGLAELLAPTSPESS